MPLVLRRRCRLQQQRHLFDAEHRRDPPRVRHDGEPACQIRPVKRHREEEAQRRDRAVDARRLHAALCLAQLEEAQLFRRRGVGRPADESRECPHLADIIAPRVLLEAAHAHVFDHARPQRADGLRRIIGGHRVSPELKVAGPSMLRIGRPDRHPLLRFTSKEIAPTPTRAPLPRAGTFSGASASGPGRR